MKVNTYGVVASHPSENAVAVVKGSCLLLCGVPKAIHQQPHCNPLEEPFQLVFYIVKSPTITTVRQILHVFTVALASISRTKRCGELGIRENKSPIALSTHKTMGEVDAAVLCERVVRAVCRHTALVSFPLGTTVVGCDADH